MRRQVKRHAAYGRNLIDMHPYAFRLQVTSRSLGASMQRTHLRAAGSASGVRADRRGVSSVGAGGSADKATVDQVRAGRAGGPRHHALGAVRPPTRCESMTRSHEHVVTALAAVAPATGG